jgi:uncharacterized protein YkwD
LRARVVEDGHHRWVRPTLLIAIVLIAGLATFAIWPRDSHTRADPCGPVHAPPQQSGITAAGAATICLVNRQRTSRGLPALRESSLLSSASLEHSQDMVKLGYFEHTAADGRTVGDRLRAVGYGGGATVSAGENIAYGVGAKATPASIVDLWMHSPGHRADILRRAYTEIGIGIALGAPQIPMAEEADAATYTTDFGGVFDPSLPNG